MDFIMMFQRTGLSAKLVISFEKQNFLIKNVKKNGKYAEYLPFFHVSSMDFVILS